MFTTFGDRLMFGSWATRQVFRHATTRHCARRIIAAALALTYLAIAAGVPLPTIRNSTKSSEAFPCATSACGCDSAEKCWRSCCCHTLAERLAWADKNGVKPPAFALVEAREARLDTAGRPLDTKVVKVAVTTKSCCSKKRACCESTATRSCCSSHNKVPDKADAANFVVAYRALGCHGQSFNWLAAVQTLIAVELELADQLPLSAWLGPHSSDIAAGVSDVPTPPPPERA